MINPMKRSRWSTAGSLVAVGLVLVAVTWIATGRPSTSKQSVIAQWTAPAVVCTAQQQVDVRIGLRKRSIAALRKFYAVANQTAVAKSVQWEPFRPIVDCPTEQRLGFAGDGGKWVCVTPKLARREPCLVYSIGSNAQVDFETAIRDAFGCEIHVFDPTLDAQDLKVLQPFIDAGTLIYHPWGVSLRDEVRPLTRKNKVFNASLRTIDSIMAELGHKALDILKIDIEGFEWAVLPVFMRRGMPSVGQLLLEVHDYAPFMNDLPPQNGQAFDKIDVLFDLMETHGLYAFHSEVNALWDMCSEFAFVHHSVLPPVAPPPAAASGQAPVPGLPLHR